MSSVTQRDSLSKYSQNGRRVPENLLMEHFSAAYLRAIASAAGCSVDKVESDIDSVDFLIQSRGYVELNGKTSRKRSRPVGVQLKCTHHHKPSNGTLRYPLKIKNYDDLRDTDNSYPRILVVVWVPDSWKKRLIWTPEELRLLHCAFWTSLWGREESSNTSAVSIELTKHLSPNALREIVFQAADGDLQ